MSTSTLSTSTLSASSSAANPSSSSTCNTNFLASNPSIPSSVRSQGQVCYFNWPEHINFTSCCAPNATIGYADTCLQYCVVPSGSDISTFTNCAKFKLPQNSTASPIWGCSPQSNSAAASSSQQSANVRLAVPLVLLAVSAVFFGL